MSSNHPSSDDPCDEHLPEGELSQLRASARRLVDAIAAEPVPERLRELAIELGKMIDRQREELDDIERSDETSRTR